MAQDDVSIKISVDADTSKAEKDLDSLSKSASKLGDSLKGVGKVGAAAFAAIGTAAAGLTTAFVKGTADVAEYGDNIDKMSQKLGISAKSYQEWDAVMQHSGTSMDSMKTSMKSLTAAASKGSKAFEKIGLSQEAVANMSKEDLFSATIAGLQGIEDESDRAAAATELLGKGAVELGALLNTSAEDTQAMKDRVHELGGVMSDDAVAASAKFQDSLQDMQTAFKGMSRGLMSDFMPAMTTIMDGLTEVFSGDSAKGIKLLSDGVKGFTDTLLAELPTVLEVGTGIVNALLDAIVENLPSLLKAGTDAVMAIADGLIQNLPQIIKAGLEVILSLANGIADSLPELIPTIVDVVIEIVDTLIDNVDKLVDAAIAIIIALAEGLINSLPKLLEKAPTIVQRLVSAFIENAPKLLASALELIVTLAKGLVDNIPTLLTSVGDIVAALVQGFANSMSAIWDIGKNIVTGVWEGIKSAAGWFTSQVTGFFSGIVDDVKDFLGIASPSKVFAGIGNFMMQGMAKGVEEGAKYAIAATRSAIDDVNNVALNGVSPIRLGVSGVGIPRLASGAVIPPNQEFMAVLGDQRSGINIESPLSTMVDAFKQALYDFGVTSEGVGDIYIPVYVNNELTTEQIIRRQDIARYRSNGK